MKLKDFKISLWIIGLLSILLYSNTAFFDYALDDTLVITANDYTKQGIYGIPDILSSDGFEGFFGKDQQQLLSGSRYRPLSQITFALEYQFFGLNPMVSHIGNILIYAITCLLFFVILLYLFDIRRDKKFYFSLPFLAAIIFCIHPIHTEVVANIKGRDELLALLFSLLALFFSLRYVEKQKIRSLVATGIFFLLAVFSKENALTFWLIIPLSMYFFTEAKKKDYWRIFLSLTIPLIIFMLARRLALGFWLGSMEVNELLNNPYLHATTTQKYASILLTWLLYFKLLIFPHPLTHDYYPFQIPLVEFTDYRVLICIAILLFLLVMTIIGFRKKKAYAYAILFYFMSFSLQSNLLLNIGTFMNERFVYMSSIGFAILMAYLIAEKCIPFLSRGNLRLKAFNVLLLLIALGFCAKTVLRNFAWKDDYTLFTTDVVTSSSSAKVKVSAAGKLTEKAMKEEDPLNKQELLQQALTHLNAANELYPQNASSWFLLGDAYREMGIYGLAVDAYKKSLNLRPTYKEALNNLHYTAVKAKENKNYLDSKNAYLFLSKMDTSNADYKLELVDNYKILGLVDSAAAIVNQALTQNPDDVRMLNKKAELLAQYQNAPQQALNLLMYAYELDSSVLQTNENLGIIYGMMKNCSQSIYYFEKALEIEPENTRILRNIGYTYINCRELVKSDEYFERAEKIDAAKTE